MQAAATRLNELPALELRRMILRREIRPQEVAAEFLRAIRAIDPKIRSYVTVDDDMTMRMAVDVERRLAAGEDLPLAGIPYALKDLTDTAGLRTTYGSHARQHNVPRADAAVARRLKDAGGTLLGKTNTPEFGNRATTAFGLFPATLNPWRLDLTAGGSSGGSAAAVAACLTAFAEGSDGGGSIRIPSSCCGVVGLKASRGRISNAPNANPRGGLITHGPIARTVRDAALMLDVMAGHEPGDPFYAPPHPGGFLAAADETPPRLRIGLLLESDKWIDPQVVKAVEETATLLRTLGHHVEDADVDLTGLGPLFRIMAESEGAANDVDPSQYSDAYSVWCHERGAKLSAVEFIRATEEMFRKSREIIAAALRWDVLLTPTVTLPPQPVATFLATVERVAEDDLAYIPFTYPFNITGQPAISLPLGWSADATPIGVQLVGPPFGEARLISLAAEIEAAAPWRSRYPATMARLT